MKSFAVHCFLFFLLGSGSCGSCGDQRLRSLWLVPLLTFCNPVLLLNCVLFLLFWSRTSRSSRSSLSHLSPGQSSQPFSKSACHRWRSRTLATKARTLRNSCGSGYFTSSTVNRVNSASLRSLMAGHNRKQCSSCISETSETDSPQSLHNLQSICASTCCHMALVPRTESKLNSCDSILILAHTHKHSTLE